MRTLIDRPQPDFRIVAGPTAAPRRINLGNFLSHVAASALLDPRAPGCRFTVAPVHNDVTVYANPELLSSAIGTLLQNAFRATEPNTEVRLHAHASADRVLIDVEDHCGGLPKGATDTLLSPFSRGEDRLGPRMALDTCRRNVEANHGELRMRDVPGCGCIFTIDLPVYLHRN